MKLRPDTRARGRSFSLGYSLRHALWECFGYSLRHSLRDDLGYNLRYSLQDNLWDNLQGSFWKPIKGFKDEATP